jgi:hypothetical protein
MTNVFGVGEDGIHEQIREWNGWVATAKGAFIHVLLWGLGGVSDIHSFLG